MTRLHEEHLLGKDPLIYQRSTVKTETLCNKKKKAKTKKNQQATQMPKIAIPGAEPTCERLPWTLLGLAWLGLAWPVWAGPTGQCVNGIFLAATQSPVDARMASAWRNVLPAGWQPSACQAVVLAVLRWRRSSLLFCLLFCLRGCARFHPALSPRS